MKNYINYRYDFDNFCENNEYVFKAKLELTTGGNYGYTFRVVPKHEMLPDPENLNLIKWITD